MEEILKTLFNHVNTTGKKVPTSTGAGFLNHQQYHVDAHVGTIFACDTSHTHTGSFSQLPDVVVHPRIIFSELSTYSYMYSSFLGINVHIYSQTLKVSPGKKFIDSVNLGFQTPGEEVFGPEKDT